MGVERLQGLVHPGVGQTYGFTARPIIPTAPPPDAHRIHGVGLEGAAIVMPLRGPILLIRGQPGNARLRSPAVRSTPFYPTCGGCSAPDSNVCSLRQRPLRLAHPPSWPYRLLLAPQRSSLSARVPRIVPIQKTLIKTTLCRQASPARFIRAWVTRVPMESTSCSWWRRRNFSQSAGSSASVLLYA